MIYSDFHDTNNWDYSSSRFSDDVIVYMIHDESSWQAVNKALDKDLNSFEEKLIASGVNKNNIVRIALKSVVNNETTIKEQIQEKAKKLSIEKLCN